MQCHSSESEAQVYKVCPRNRKFASSDKLVEITFHMLQPYFNKPLTEAADELGLSATAIKKACRKFGIPKWPFRTLTSKSSRNRSAFQAITLRLSGHCDSEIMSSPCSEESSSSSEEEEQQPQQQQPAKPQLGLDTSCTAFQFSDDGFDEFARTSSCESEIECEESYENLWAPPVEYCLEEAKASDLKSPRRVTEDSYMSFLDSGDAFEEPMLGGYDAHLFDWNTGM